MHCTILAISKAGGIYIPLDPSVPVDRNAYILSDSSPHIVITNKKYKQLTVNCNVVCVEELDSWLKEDVNHLSPSDPLNISYVIYTSGSTGNPKGVMVHHQGMMNHIFCKIRDLKLRALAYKFNILYSISLGYKT